MRRFYASHYLVVFLSKSYLADFWRDACLKEHPRILFIQNMGWSCRQGYRDHFVAGGPLKIFDFRQDFFNRKHSFNTGKHKSFHCRQPMGISQLLQRFLLFQTEHIIFIFPLRLQDMLVNQQVTQSTPHRECSTTIINITFSPNLRFVNACRIT